MKEPKDLFQVNLIMRKEKAFIIVLTVVQNFLLLLQNLIVELGGLHFQKLYPELLKQKLIVNLEW